MKTSQPDHASNLGKMLDFGADCMKRQNINIPKLRGAKKVFFPMLLAAQSYTEAIFVLCREHRTFPCSALLRSLLENLINAKFLLCDPAKNVHVIYLKAVTEKKKQLTHGHAFLKLNPLWGLENHLSIKAVENSLRKTLTQEKRTKTKLNKHVDPPIFEMLARAQYVDKRNAFKKKKSASLEGFYILLYRTLSSSTHINFLDFRRYFKLTPDGITIFLSGDPDETPFVTALAEFFYKEMLWAFLKIFKSPLLKEFEKSWGTHTVKKTEV